jgi:hypothetical protein
MRLPSEDLSISHTQSLTYSIYSKMVVFYPSLLWGHVAYVRMLLASTAPTGRSNINMTQAKVSFIDNPRIWF